MTPHIEAKKEDIAQIVLMPGDPLRAKYIAETYLKDYKLVNKVRNMFAYTGFYKEKRITVMASGMGMPSIGIYAYELFNFYDVDTIIRVGTIGSATKDLNLYDVVLASEAVTSSTFANNYNGKDVKIVEASEELNKKILEVDQNIRVGRIYTADVFYGCESPEQIYNEYKAMGSEMESFALFYIAKSFNKKATSILTVSDNLVTKEKASAEERETQFNKMILIALESTLKH